MRQPIFYLAALIVLSYSMSSCGGDDNNIDEPVNSNENRYPSELVGTWFYHSGDPSSLFVDFEGNDILNITYTLTSNGNLQESFVYYSGDYSGKSTSTLGNWYVENKKLIITDWNANMIHNGLSYKFNNDNSLTITINGKSSLFYRQEDIEKIYKDLIIGTWNNNALGGGKTRITFNRDGSGHQQSTYINGFYYGSTHFSWSCNGNELTIKNDDAPQSNTTKINYVNKKSFSWGTSYFTKE